MKKNDFVRMGKQKWSIIYPVYIDQKKTISEGRRISAANATVLPTTDIIADALKELKYEFEIEAEKQHPKDFENVGRVRFRYRNENGELIRPEFKNKKQLYEAIAKSINEKKSKKQESINNQTKKKNKK
eukprot:TRINITY_DN9895_c0_g1_i1.p1 TRINITY_DN9895_c0_g1~~TRINITY_DN9895_c0_g1_i1.p1  ORF type:complete len:129 (+),score=35.38 TRINITY_DN9895_c0_g1_i1:368-754(+)